MAPDLDIGSVHIDVTTDIELVKKKIQAVLASIGNLDIKVDVDKSDLTGISTAVAAEGKKAQAELTAAQKKGISDRRTNREKAEAVELKSQKDLNRDLVASREKAALEIARIQQDAAADERKQKSASKAYAKIVDAEIAKSAAESAEARKDSAQNAEQKIRISKAATTDFVAKEEAKQLTLVEKGEAAQVASVAKGEAAKVAANAKADAAIRAGKAKLANDSTLEDRKGKERQERTRFTFQQRELFAQRAQQRSLELIIARSQAKIAAFGNKPIGLGILNGLTKINSSLVEFDRVASRVLKTSLLSFTAWSAGVAAVAGAAATAAIVSFAKFEQAVARASAVFASDKFTTGLIAGGNNLKTFAQLAEESSAKVVKASNQVALTTLFNPREVAEGARALAQAGLTEKEALDKTASGYSNLATVAAFAQNEQIDFASATEFLTGGLVSAGLKMGQLTELTDKFTTVANATNASAQQVAEAFSNQGAAAFRAYGQSAEQALTVIGLLAKANERGLKAGTTAAILIREINNASVNKAPEAFKKYGIEVGKANGKTVPFTKTLTQLTTLFRETEEREGSQGFAKLRKELGLTEKSLRGLILLTPQVAELGQEGVDRFTNIITKSAGATQRQASVVTKTLSFQFQNLVESITIQFQHFGEAAGKSLAAVFDRFNGPDGIIKSLEPDVIRLGERFGALISKFGEFIDSPEAKQGALIILDALKITLIGVRDTFKQFASAFGEVENGQSAFVAFAKSVRAFSEASATVLPIVARAIGEIINLLIQNKDAFEVFAKVSIGLFIARRAFALTIIPVKALTEGILAARTAVTVMAVSSESGVIASGLGALATKIGFVDKASKSATDSLLAMQGASAFAPGTRGNLARKAAGNAGISAAASAGPAAIAAKQLAEQAKLTKLVKLPPGFEGPENFVAAFGKSGAASDAAKGISLISTELKGFAKISADIVKFGKPFLRFAGAVGAVIAILEAGFKFFKGFIAGLKESTQESEDSRRGLELLGRAADKAFDVLKVALPIVLDLMEGMLDVIGLLGRLFGRVFGDALAGVVRFADAFDKLIHGDIIGAMNDFAHATIDFIVKPVREALLFVLEAVDNTIGKLAKIPLVGDKFKDEDKALKGAIKSVKGLSFEIDVVKKSSDKVGKSLSASMKEVADQATKTSTAFGGVAASIDRVVDSTSRAKMTHDTYAKAVNSSTFAGAFAKTVDDAQRFTKANIDLYKSLIGTSEEAIRKRRLLGITEAEASKKLFAQQELQIKSISTGPLAELGKQFRGIGATAGNISPRLNKDALNVINAQIHAFQQKKREIRALDLPANQENKLIGQANAAIIKLREFVVKNPVRIIFSAGGENFEGFSNKDQAVNALIATYKKVIENPVLLKQLTESQRALFEKSRKEAFEQGGGDDLTLANILAKLDAGAANKEGGRRVKEDAFKLGVDIAAGLSGGAKAGDKKVAAAGVGNANAYLMGLNTVLLFGSPSKKTFELGLFISQGLANGIKIFSILPESEALLAGLRVTRQYANGITIGGAFVNAAVINVVTNASRILSGVGYALAVSSGVRYMMGLKAGMLDYFNSTIAPFLHDFIPKRIAELKGPVAYDATILVPAGEAVMHGFDRGLRKGFGGVESFLKDVGPSMEEHVPDSLFADRTKKFMVDVAMGKAPDPYDFYKDLIPAEFFGGFGGILDPALSFLHPTLSLADTEEMAAGVAKMFNLHVGSTYRSPAENAAVGGSPTSQHMLGQAADVSGSNSAMNKAASELYAKAASAFKQIIFNNRDYIGGFDVPDHMDHVHLGWKPGDGFDIFSGKKGSSGFDFPEASPEVDAAIAYAAKATKLDPMLIAAVMKQESGFRKDVVSFDGGYGLMQLTSQSLVDAADRLGGRLNPQANALVGSKYLSDLIKQLGSVPLGLSAYNSGPGGGEGSGHVDVPSYVSSVLGFLDDFRKKFGGAREHGGPVDANRPYLVGEKGPELMMPRTNGHIVNAQTTAAMMNGQMGSQKTLNVTNNIQTNAQQPAAILGYIRAHTQGDLATLGSM